jgi:hypothetical protein
MNQGSAPGAAAGQFGQNVVHLFPAPDQRASGVQVLVGRLGEAAAG